MVNDEIGHSSFTIRHLNVPTVDQVMVEERAAAFTKRSIKTSAKLAGLKMAVSMCDLTTLEGKDTPGKVGSLCQKARHPHDDPAIPTVAAVCVYPAMVKHARRALGEHRPARVPDADLLAGDALVLAVRPLGQVVHDLVDLQSRQRRRALRTQPRAAPHRRRYQSQTPEQAGDGHRLVNALVGEAIAPTDATEATRIVTWFRHGPIPKVTANHVVLTRA